MATATKPTLAFVLPIYNGERYLDEAVRSILAQSDPSWEILLIDDASTDGSAEIMRRFQDPRIRCLTNPQNRGLYGTLRRAMEEIAADWISILMQDDRLKPWYVEEMLQLAQRYPEAQALWATEDLIDGSGQEIRPGPDTSRIEVIEPGASAWKSAMMRGCIWTISGSCTRRELFERQPFRADLPHCGDFEWLLRAIRQAPFVYYERPLAEIRLHAEQASSHNLRSGRDMQEAYRILQWNFCRHSDDLARREAAAICWRRSRLLARRCVSSAVRGRWNQARLTSRYFFRFLCLPLSYRWRSGREALRENAAQSSSRLECAAGQRS